MKAAKSKENLHYLNTGLRDIGQCEVKHRSNMVGHPTPPLPRAIEFLIFSILFQFPITKKLMDFYLYVHD